ncbi:hypothetical protein DM01DRAFT_1333324 [Hesseltinella vesiculosa]|uniref:BAG domain-containing protein n=1 Tax=Hesseltinella vesiculosa TaxID=101127 RepID=A0A1X2GPM8_9FUNG|nr:hypothetical protein DM01DRAFT_1333324 [Hesseltinella vesiculosa]
MKKDDAPLSQYGVRPGSKLRLMTSKPNEQEKRPTQESVTLDELHRIQQKLTNTLMPEIDEYQHQVQTYNTTATKTEDAKQKLITRGLYFGEILMQILFDFDGVVCHAGFDQSRQLRKQGVKTSQDLLEKVDRIRDSIA